MYLSLIIYCLIETHAPPVKRRGRPPKNVAITNNVAQDVQKRKRGRPRKVVVHTDQPAIPILTTESLDRPSIFVPPTESLDPPTAQLGIPPTRKRAAEIVETECGKKLRLDLGPVRIFVISIAPHLTV